MLIAIASDLHDNLTNWQIFNNYLNEQGINTLLFCGDLCNNETLQHIRQEFPGKIYFIAGNQELYDFQEAENLKNAEFLGRHGAIEIKNIKIGLIHEPNFKEKLLRERDNLNFIFYGHTHKPWIENEGSLVVANPGTLGGVFYRASFALLNTKTKKLELKILDQL
ncbi:metallophosphoesterase family protein [Patescibacteria group bacterium]|nr:metallophosphoesterase family protein [Patescibacteria group bacterium]